MLEADGGIGPERSCSLEPLVIPSRGDDVRGAEQLGRLHGDEPDRAGGPEHEHTVRFRNRRPPGDGHPARHPGDAARSGYLVGNGIRKRDAEVCGSAPMLGQQSVTREA